MSDDVPVSPDAAKFLANVLEATRRGTLPWETTADPATLVSQLEGDYSLKLELVPDLDGQQTPEPDHRLSLSKGRRTVLTIDRKDFTIVEIKRVLAGFENVYQVFLDLWKRAFLKANKVSDEITEVNRILDKMLSPNAL